jgi:hypothetical protein
MRGTLDGTLVVVLKQGAHSELLRTSIRAVLATDPRTHDITLSLSAVNQRTLPSQLLTNFSGFLLQCLHSALVSSPFHEFPLRSRFRAYSKGA